MRLLSKITGVFSGLLGARIRDADSSRAFVDSHQIGNGAVVLRIPDLNPIAKRRRPAQAGRDGPNEVEDAGRRRVPSRAWTTAPSARSRWALT